MKTATTTALLAAGCLALAARTPATAAEPAPAAASAWEALDTSVTLGYQSRYVLYGYRLTRHLWHADVFGYLPLNETVSAWAGSWYGYLNDGTYREVDLYAGLDIALGERLGAGVGYSLFNYLEVPFPSDDVSHEWMARLTFTSGPFALTLKEQYDTEAGGHLVRAVASFDRALHGPLSVSAAAEYGHAFGYFIEGDAPNHALFTLRLPVRLGASATAAPFVARSLALDAIDAFERDETYGGLAVTFPF